MGGQLYACPSGTTSAAGAGSQVACVCQAGYACQRVRTLDVQVYTGVSVGQLTSELGVVLAELGSLAGVPSTQVFMYGVNASGVV